MLIAIDQMPLLPAFGRDKLSVSSFPSAFLFLILHYYTVMEIEQNVPLPNETVKTIPLAPECYHYICIPPLILYN